jgi:hypothetical protein
VATATENGLNRRPFSGLPAFPLPTYRFLEAVRAIATLYRNLLSNLNLPWHQVRTVRRKTDKLSGETMAELAIIKACDVLNQALPAGINPITDADITCECLSCKNSILLSDCTIEQNRETIYKCECGATLIRIAPPSPVPSPGAGYRLGDFVLRNAGDVRCGPVLIPRSPNALRKEGSEEGT